MPAGACRLDTSPLPPARLAADVRELSEGVFELLGRGLGDYPPKV
jgi:hypothetical protein